MRGGTVIAKGVPDDEWGDGAINVSNLVAGDVLNVYRGTTLLGAVSYAGRPMVRQDACAGRTSFTVVRDEDAVIDGAGAFVPTGGGSGDHEPRDLDPDRCLRHRHGGSPADPGRGRVGADGRHGPVVE